MTNIDNAQLKPDASVSALPRVPSHGSGAARRVSLLMLGCLTAWMAAAAVWFGVGLARLENGAAGAVAGGTTGVAGGGAADVGRVESATLLFVGMWGHAAAAILAACAAAMVGRRRAAGPALPRIILLVCLISGLASVDQIVGRYVPPADEDAPIFTPHAARGWYHRRNAAGTIAGVRTRTNALGFRGAALPGNKANGEFRVLCLGDSVTFGHCLADGQTWVDAFNRAATGGLAGRAVTAINAGVPGYATAQELDLMLSEGLAAKPDLVILQVCFNDVPDMINTAPGMISGVPMNFVSTDSNHWSGIVRAIQSVVMKRKLKAMQESQMWAGNNAFTGKEGMRRSDQEMYADPPLPEMAKGWQNMLATLDRIAAECGTRGIDFIVVFFPVDRQMSADGESINPEATLTRWATDKGVAYVDLADAFRAESRRLGFAKGALMMDDVHLSAAGARLAGEVLAEFVAKRISGAATTPTGK